MNVTCPVCGEGYPEGRPEAGMIRKSHENESVLRDALSALVEAWAYDADEPKAGGAQHLVVTSFQKLYPDEFDAAFRRGVEARFGGERAARFFQAPVDAP